MDASNVQHLTVSEPFLRLGSLLAEGPFYRPEDDTLHFVDIIGKLLYRVPLSGSPPPRALSIEDAVGVAGLIEGDNDNYIVAAKRGFALLNQESGELKYLAKVCSDAEQEKILRFNDGAIDCMGRFWAGSMYDFDFSYGGSEPWGVVYRYDPDGSLHRMIEGANIPNGIGW